MAVQANPLDPECEAEGKVVCSQGHIKGEPGDLLTLIPGMLLAPARSPALLACPSHLAI